MRDLLKRPYREVIAFSDKSTSSISKSRHRFAWPKLASMLASLKSSACHSYLPENNSAFFLGPVQAARPPSLPAAALRHTRQALSPGPPPTLPLAPPAGYAPA